MKILFMFLLLLNVLLSCRSSEVREIDMDNVLEEELRAEPDIFKDSKNLKANGKEPTSKSIPKKRY